jgi:MFS family permease
VNPLGDIRGRAAWVVLGALVVQMGLGYGYVFSLVAEPMIAELGWTRAEWAAALAPQLPTQALASPFVGALCVRFGARGVMAASVLMLGVGVAAMAGVQSLLGFACLIGFTGIALAGVGDITAGAVVTRWVERGRGLALGIVYTGANFGGSAFAWLGAALASRQSWGQMLVTFGAVGTLAMLPAALFAVREPRAGEGAGADPGPAGASAPAGPEPLDVDLREALRTRSFWILAFALFAILFYFVAMIRHMVLFLRDAGYSPEEAARFYGAGILLGAVSKILFGLLADRLPVRTSTLVNASLIALSSLLVFLVPRGVLWVWLFLLVYGFSVNARDVMFPLAVAHCFGVRTLAKIYGALTLVLLPAGALGPILAGAVFDRRGSYDLAFAVFAALNAVAVALLFGVRREGRPGAGAALGRGGR